MHSSFFRRAGAPAAVVGLALLLTGCTSSGEGEAKSPIRGIAEATGFATTPPPAADFVQKTRPADANYLPVGVTPPARGQKAKSPEEIRAMESELDATLNQHSTISGVRRPGQSYTSAAPKPQGAAQPVRGADRFVIPPKPEPTPPARTRAKPKPAATAPGAT
ncbi:hypothetical protein [Alsobacter sp. R-9]